MLSRPPRATMVIKDRRGHPRTLRAVLVEDAPPATTWHYEVHAEPSRSKRTLHGADGETVDRVLGRMAAQLTPPRHLPKRPKDDDDE